MTHGRLLFLLVLLSQPTLAQKLESGGALPVPGHSNDREFIDCIHITITMDTLKVSNTVKIAGVVGLNCTN